MSESWRLVIGIRSDQALGQLAEALGQRLDLAFVEPESSYFGGAYFRAGTIGHDEAYLFRNVDPIDGSAYYATATDFPIILRLEGTPCKPTGALRATREATGGEAELLCMQ